MRWLWPVLLCCAACSLDQAGLGQADDDGGLLPDVTPGDVTVPDVNVPDTGAADVGLDVVEEPGPPLPCTTDASVCSGTVPQGWSLVAYEANRSTACPGNFTTTDVVASPTLQAGACTCSCNVTTQPSCALGTVTVGYSGNNQCNFTLPPMNITTEGQCVDYGIGTFTPFSYNSYTKLPLTPGTCTTAAATDTSKVGSTPTRTCIPPQTCAEDVCNGDVPQGMRACIVGAGDVACPAGPFSDKAAVVGSDTSLTCGACSACSVTASACGNGTVKYWGDSSCTQAKGTIAADGKCNATGTPSGVNHFTYENPVQNVKCNAGTSTPTADLAGKQTVCCRP